MFQALAQTQPLAIAREVENSITERTGGEKQLPGLLDGDDIRQTRRFRWLDQIQVRPRLVQHMGIEELQAIQIELDGTPGMSVEQIVEYLGPDPDKRHFNRGLSPNVEKVDDINASGVAIGDVSRLYMYRKYLANMSS